MPKSASGCAPSWNPLAGWSKSSKSERMGHPIHNIIAKRNDEAPQIILGAHYDTRMIADNDPDPSKHSEPVPGANDGASGVAVLLELARSLPEDTVPVWLVFFDTEDNGKHRRLGLDFRFARLRRGNHQFSREQSSSWT